jgi:hypothetical protein
MKVRRRTRDSRQGGANTDRPRQPARPVRRSGVTLTLTDRPASPLDISNRLEWSAVAAARSDHGSLPDASRPAGSGEG